VTTPEVIEIFHELIVEDRWISAKPKAEQLSISLSRLGATFMKIWTRENLREGRLEMSEPGTKTLTV
jgi:hypothetical protein